MLVGLQLKRQSQRDITNQTANHLSLLLLRHEEAGFLSLSSREI